MIKEAYIYGLYDPRTNEIRYVGKTKNSIECRLREHLCDARNIMHGNKRRRINKRYAWIISLLIQGELPGIKLLEIVSLDNWKAREIHWIARLPCLTNMTIGGDGGGTTLGMKFGPVPEERKKLISQRTKEAMQSPEIKAKCRVGGLISSSKLKETGISEEIKQKISIGVKRAMWDPVIRERQLRGLANRTKRLQEERLSSS